MFKSYITTALRNVRRHRGYAFINIFGLATGLAACLLIALYVRFELSYDRMHENADRIVRVEMFLENNPPGQQEWKTNILAVGPELLSAVTGIEDVVRLAGGYQVAVQVGDVRNYEEDLFQADPAWFDVFDVSVASGDPAELERPYTMMLSASMAHKYFREEDPIGKTVAVGEQYDIVTKEFEVVGVYEDLPFNVHVRPAFLASIATTEMEAEDGTWHSLAYTYALMREGYTIERFDADVESFEKNVLQANFSKGASFSFRPLTRIHLHSGGARDIRPQGDIRYVWIFSGIAVLILVIACINYMNLATARSAQRAREVGIRKVVGAHRGQLIRQFLSESTLFAVVALVLSVGIAQGALPAFASMMDRPLSFSALDVELLGYLVAVTIIVGLVSGSYPALLLSRLRPSAVLKGSGSFTSNAFLRKGLVVFQFVVSMSLIVGTIVIQKQLDFVREANLGFEKEQIAILQTRGRLGESTTAFREAIARQAGVQNVALGNSLPGQPVGGLVVYGPDELENYQGEDLRFDFLAVDHDYLPMLGMEIIEGRAFSRDFPSDPGSAVMLNEAAVRALGWKEPIGKFILDSRKRMEVIGVVADFHYQSKKFDINPLIIELGSRDMNFAAVKLATSDIPGTLTGLKAVWEQFIPDLPFQYSFMDDEFEAMYRSEQRLASLFQAFALVAIVIAALGLFGLAAYTAQRRTKEIGIRKVLGASVSVLVVMLSKEFVRLVLVAFVLAAPLAYFVMDNWLTSFAYRIEIGAGVFLLAGSMALGIALVSVGWQATRAATSDPVKSLRYE